MKTANPNANANAKEFLNWLAGLPDRPDKRVISGQQIDSYGDIGYDTYIATVYNETKHWIALIGSDYAFDDWSKPGFNSKLIDHWNDGGLITLCWHAYNPWTGGIYNDRSMNGGDFSDLYTPGNDAYDTWRADMDEKAVWLNDLQSNRVVVLWRPFHEMNAQSFWWGDRDQAKFIAAWQDMFDYLTNTKGLNNLLWVYAPNAEHPWTTNDAEYYYPGGDYVDVVGLDNYPWDGRLTDMPDQGYLELLALGKPFALTEFGPYGGDPEPDPDTYDYDTLIEDIETYVPKTTYFVSWSNNWAIVNQRNAQELLDGVITRDEVDWSSGPDPDPDPDPDEIIIDDTDAGFSTSFSQEPWQKYTQDGGQHYGNSHYYKRKIGSGQDTATWSFTVAKPGNYDVYAWWWEENYRPRDVPYTVNHFHGSKTVRVDQRANGGQWNWLGTFYWRDEGSVVVSDDVSSGRDIVADAIRLVYRSEGEKKTLREELEILRAKLEALDVVDGTAMLVHVDNALARLEEFEAAKEATLGIE
jgi:mannan endo-1,4-beta-mannosidase